jgi:hypothetical protein
MHGWAKTKNRPCTWVSDTNRKSQSEPDFLYRLRARSYFLFTSAENSFGRIPCARHLHQSAHLSANKLTLSFAEKKQVISANMVVEKFAGEETSLILDTTCSQTNNTDHWSHVLTPIQQIVLKFPPTSGFRVHHHKCNNKLVHLNSELSFSSPHI